MWADPGADAAVPVPRRNAFGYAAVAVLGLFLAVGSAWPDHTGAAPVRFLLFWVLIAPLCYLAAIRLLRVTTGRAIGLAAATTLVCGPAAGLIYGTLQDACRHGGSGDYPRPIPAFLTIVAVALPLAGFTAPVLRGPARWLWPLALLAAAALGAEVAGFVVGSHGGCDWDI
jgi:hypothetical protein